MAGAVTTLVEGGSFFEGPRWHAGNWWVSDFYRHAVFRVSPDGREEQVMEVPNQPSGLGWLPDGSMLVVSMRDRRLLRRLSNGSVREHADLSSLATGHANDMVVDALGRAWVGNLGFDLLAGADPQTTVLIRVDPDGRVAAVADGMYLPNGSVITPDGRTLVVAESFGGRLTAFTIGHDGTLTDRRVWAQLAPVPDLTTTQALLQQVTLVPDGIALDAEGHIWVADAIGTRCIRVAPGGGIVDEITDPDGHSVFACMLGGADGRTLLLCCAPDFDEHARATTRKATLKTCNVDVPRAGLP